MYIFQLQINENNIFLQSINFIVLWGCVNVRARIVRMCESGQKILTLDLEIRNFILQRAKYNYSQWCPSIKCQDCSRSIS